MKKKSKRTYKLYPLSNSLSQVYKKSSGQNDSQFLNLIKNWENIVGKEYAKILSPIKISSKNATLVVSSDKSFSTESNYIAPMLIDKINAFYGYSAIKKINFTFRNKQNIKNKKIVQTPLKEETREKIEEIVCNISDDGLKNSLEALGESMAKKGKIK